MSIKDFLLGPNVQMLWEVLIDEDTILKDRRTQEIFAKTLPEFYEREKSNKQTTLIGLNKQFISLMLNLLRQPPAQVARTIPPPAKKILITQEELQNDRAAHFEQELNKKQQEFTSAMAVPVPTTPVFTDNTKDEPLTEMNMIIQRTIAERNLELDKFYKSANKADAENWLKSAPTSIKEEKAVQKANVMKTIKIEKNDLNISLLTEELNDAASASAKQISWGNNTTIEPNETTQPNDSIFSKLKKTFTQAPLPPTTSTPAPTMDIQTLYEYVNKRFDQLEELIRQERRLDN
jgi:type III secretory pathway component EscV